VYNVRINANDELESKWSGRTVERSEKSQSGQKLSGRKFEPMTYRKPEKE
jgi:hypothetical protein